MSDIVQLKIAFLDKDGEELNALTSIINQFSGDDFLNYEGIRNLAEYLAEQICIAAEVKKVDGTELIKS